MADDLSPIRVLALFSAVDGNDLELLDLACRPEHLLMSHLPVPPVCIRPSVEMDTGAGSNEDDITMKLMARPSARPAVWVRQKQASPNPAWSWASARQRQCQLSLSSLMVEYARVTMPYACISSGHLILELFFVKELVPSWTLLAKHQLPLACMFISKRRCAVRRGGWVDWHNSWVSANNIIAISDTPNWPQRDPGQQ